MKEVKNELKIKLFNILEKTDILKVNSYHVEYNENKKVSIDISFKSAENADHLINEINEMLNGLTDIHMIKWDTLD